MVYLDRLLYSVTLLRLTYMNANKDKSKSKSKSVRSPSAVSVWEKRGDNSNNKMAERVS